MGSQVVKVCSWSTAKGRRLGSGSSEVAVPTTCRRSTSAISRSQANWKNSSTLERSGPSGFALSALASGRVTLKSVSSRPVGTSSRDSCGMGSFSPSRLWMRISTEVYPTRVRTSIGDSSPSRRSPGIETVSTGARLPRPSAAPM